MAGRAGFAFADLVMEGHKQGWLVRRRGGTVIAEKEVACHGSSAFHYEGPLHTLALPC
jgi:hypothetical protein